MKGANISPKNDYEGELRGAYTSPIWVRKRVGRRICPVYMLVKKRASYSTPSGHNSKEESRGTYYLT